jgi:hypothetical protein
LAERSALPNTWVVSCSSVIGWDMWLWTSSHRQPAGTFRVTGSRAQLRGTPVLWSGASSGRFSNTCVTRIRTLPAATSGRAGISAM